MDKDLRSEKVSVGEDFNGYLGCDADCFLEDHGGFRNGQVNGEEVRLVEWAFGKGLRLMNTCFEKRKTRLITFQLVDIETF